ncbi:MAG: response regulator transcription factor, partial [Deltaproteobacteria bacterium]|nr:response regulator transcription factor [Deltaproteobacteria bacterium]
MTGLISTSDLKGPYRVMIVDSDPLQRMALAALISRIDGFIVIKSTGDFKVALELCCRDLPDLVFIDIVIPWLSGLDLASEILSTCRGVSVYVMSNHDYGEVVNHILELNITGFISKPIDPEELTPILLGHKRTHS